MGKDASRWTPENPPPLVRPGEKTLFTPVRDWLARRRELSWPAKFLYARLERYAGRKLTARPTQAQLAAEMGVPVRTLKRYLAELRVDLEGMPLLWVQQTGDGRAALYRFTAHPWRAEVPVDNSGREIAAGPKVAQLNGSARTEMALLNASASNGRARGGGDNNNRRQSAPRGGASRRDPFARERSNPKGQRRVAALVAGMLKGIPS